MSDSYTHISAVRRRRRNGGTHQKTSFGTLGGEDGPHEHVNGHGHAGPGPEPQQEQRTHRRGAQSEPEFDPRREWQRSDPRRALPYGAKEEEGPSTFKLPFDPWRLLAAVKRNFGWILGSIALLTLAAVIGGAFLLKYTVNLNLLRKQTPNAFNNPVQEQLTPKEYSDQTLFGFMKAGEVLQRVAEKAMSTPAFAGRTVTPGELAQAIDIQPLPNPDIVRVTMKEVGSIEPTVDLLNIYAAEVIDYMREIQQREASDLSAFLKTKLEQAEADVERLTAQLHTNFSRGYGDFDKQTEADLKRLADLKDRHQSKVIELESLEERIRSRQEQLAEQVPANTRLAEAEQQLQLLLVDKTEKHPDVIAKRREIETLLAMQQNRPAAPATGGARPVMSMANNGLYMTVLDLESQRTGLQKEIKEIGNTITNLQTSLAAGSETGVLWAMKKAELQSLHSTKTVLEEKQRRFELLAKSSMGYFSVLAPATTGSIDYKGRWIKIAVLGFMGALAGMFISVILVLLGEVTDTTLKTTEDISRITQLPVLASLGDLRRMSPSAQVNWAFRTLTILRGKLSARPDQALVCGIISSQHGEGRSTWVNLLVSAASQRGLRVLTVDTRPASNGPATASATNPERSGKPAEPEPDVAAAAAASAERANGDTASQPGGTANANNVLSPSHVAEQLQKTEEQPVVHIPLPGWVWSLERRKQWQKALEYWKNIDNLVIFVELPPACESEAVLLAEHVPQLIWLVGSGMADAAETKAQLETLRHARANLVGAVLNYAPPPMLNTRIARWFIKLTSAVILSAGILQAEAQPVESFGSKATSPSGTATVQDAASVQPAALTFSAAPRRKRAAWQERLTFGPGDTLDIHMYGNPALSRTNLFVGPDGRISYLQAQDVMASGLTVEELRNRLNEELRKLDFYKTPAQTIVIPVSFTSKKYYMLGRVAARGVYPLDRPLTIVEAVARAKGLETGMYHRTTVEMADLARSFVVRDGKRLSVDFEKLFLNGDLSQNIAIEPNDYLFFASTAANDIYVLGEVMIPGPIGFVPNATIISALTDRGGFTDKAYKRKILVIRGSLNQPETFVVDSGGILDARVPDFQLQPRDIVFVSRRPWSRIEELADEAVQSFIQGAVTAWTGVNIGPIFDKQIIPDLHSSEK